jgi:hypothetical protein
MELNLYLIIKRQNFRPFFSSIHFFAHLPLISVESFFCLDFIYCLAQYGVWFQNVLDCVWSMFNQRVHTHAQKKSIPNMITIYSKFIFFPFPIPLSIWPFLFFRLSPISYLSDPFFIFVSVSLLFLISSFCFSSPFSRFFFSRLPGSFHALSLIILHFIFIFPVLSYFFINIKINNKHNIMDLWILHPSLILNNQIFLLLNYWCNLIKNKNYSYYNLDQLMV